MTEQIDPEYVAHLNGIARFLDNEFKNGGERRVGFVLLMFPFGDEPNGRVNYISNGADRKEIVVLFKDLIERFTAEMKPEGSA